ncbi:MAG: hypothetical protein ACRDRX_04290 [Pseudonocardiaceae bacterium]
MSEQWVLSPFDCTSHALAADQPLGWLRARCGHVMPMGPHRHERPPTARICPACLGSRVPPPQFGATVPARVDPPGVPGVERDPSPPTAPARPGLRWVGCPAGGPLHLAGPVAAGGDGVALCGQGLLAAWCTLSGPVGAPCAACLAAAGGGVVRR